MKSVTLEQEFERFIADLLRSSCGFCAQKKLIEVDNKSCGSLKYESKTQTKTSLPFADSAGKLKLLKKIYFSLLNNSNYF